jgi:septum formation protein
MKQIILASGSPQRKLLLETIGLNFKIEKSNYEEDMNLKLKPRDLAKFLSRGKAAEVAKRHKNAIVIGADTFLVFKGRLLGKPHTPEKAKKMLKDLGGKWHTIITGITVIDTEKKKEISRSDEAKVFVKKLNSKEINNYVKTREPLERAGAYSITNLGSFIIEKIQGNYTTVAGLPMTLLADMLKDCGVNIFDKKWYRN